MDFVLHIACTFCFGYINTVCYEFPVLLPNEYLFKNYSHLGDSKSEIFLNAMVEIISRVCSLPRREEISFDNKLEYISIIHGEKIKNT